MRSLKKICLGLSLVAAAACKPSEAQPAWMVWLYSTEPSHPYSIAYDVSARGDIVVGAIQDQYSGSSLPVRWVQGMMQRLPLPANAIGGQANAISEDGTTIVGIVFYPFSFPVQARPVRWTGVFDVQVEVLPIPLDSIGGNAYGVNRDGSVVVGGFAYRSNTPMPRARAFRWVRGRGYEILGTFGGDYSVALDVSSDGNLVVGVAHDAQGYSQASLWQSSSQMTRLGQGWARAISPDGNLIAVDNFGSPYIVFRPRWLGWRFAFPLPTPQGVEGASGEDMSQYGYYIVGSAGDTQQIPNQPIAVRWGRFFSFENLNQVYSYLLEPGENLSSANAITPDGRCIVGQGLSLRGYTARLSAYAIYHYRGQRVSDINYDGVVDDSDLLTVLLYFGAGGENAIYADTNADGIVDDADLLTILLDFGAND